MVSEHFYSYSNQRFDLEKGERGPVRADWPLIEWERAPATQVCAKYEHYQEYIARIPALKTKPPVIWKPGDWRPASVIYLVSASPVCNEGGM